MAEMLSDAERDVIRHAAASDKYRSAPVSQDLCQEFSETFMDFAFIPRQEQRGLSSLYGLGANPLKLLQADWAEALSCRALRQFDEQTVSFPTHVQLSNGEAVDLSISRSKKPGGLPWCLSYVPWVEKLSLMRDRMPGKGAPEPTGDAAKEPERPSSLPPALSDELAAMRASNDYLTGPLPAELQEEVGAFTGNFSDAVWVSRRWMEKIIEHAQGDLDVLALLNRDWRIALESGTLRSYEGKILFPISVYRDDGTTPIEVAIKHDGRADEPGAKPWFVCYVDDYTKQKVIAGKALLDWAYLGNIDDVLDTLAKTALPERWSFEQDEGRSSCSILRNYLLYTFYRLQLEGKVLEDASRGIAAFNTGLVDKIYEPIYACFSPSTGEKPWRFEAFCKAGSRQWGKRLVSTFNPLPQRASFFSRKEDLLFDSERPLERDVDHILLDNIDRLPKEFLEEELRTSEPAMEAVEQAFSAAERSERLSAFDRLRDVVESDFKIRRRLINRLDDAIELAQKRVEWNFKTAVPAFYPTKNAMSLLLPLDLTEDDRPDVALVVELTESGAYIGQTILTMRMAYNNARLICRPDSDWLNTSLKLSDDEQLEEGD